MVDNERANDSFCVCLTLVRFLEQSFIINDNLDVGCYFHLRVIGGGVIFCLLIPSSCLVGERCGVGGFSLREDHTHSARTLLNHTFMSGNGKSPESKTVKTLKRPRPQASSSSAAMAPLKPSAPAKRATPA